MATSKELTQYFQELEAEIVDQLPELEAPIGHSLEDLALAHICVELLEESGSTTDAQFCPYIDLEGRNRCKLTGYAVNEGAARIDLFVATHLDEKVQTFPQKDLSALCGRAARFFDYAAKGDINHFSNSPETSEAAKRIFDRLGEIECVRVHVFTNGLVTDRNVQDLEIEGIPVEFSVYDLERLYRLSKTLTSRSDIDIDFESRYGRPLPCLEMKPRPSEYETYLAIFNGNLLFDLYEEYGQQLFEFNVRSFLQVKGRVNLGIRDTLKNQPERFMAYNNGLVATVDEIEIGMLDGLTVIKRMVGLQIVNGAQTTASIHRARKHDKLDISMVSVPVKITNVKPENLADFVPLISKFANTQNNIQVSDLSANHEFHIELERLSGVVWTPGESSRWFYERARGAYAVASLKAGTTASQKKRFKEESPPSQKLSKTDVARDLMAVLGRPYTVALGAQKAFGIFMSELPELYPSDWKPDADYFRQAVARAILYRSAAKVVRAKKFPAYQANIVAYLVAYLAYCSKGQLDFSFIWEAQSISDELRSVLDKWAPEIDKTIRASAKGRNVTEWCKKMDCWSEVQRLTLSIGDLPPPELSAPGDTQQDVDDASESASTAQNESGSEDVIEACMKIDAATWAKIHFWGITSGRLQYVERGVAHTLSEYAAAEWTRPPSLKQARVAQRILELASKEGIVHL